MGSINQENIANTIIFVYVLALLIWAVARASVGDQSIYVLAFNFFGVWLFSPLLILIPWVLINRYKVGALALVIPAFLFLYFYGSMFIPKPRYAGSPQTPVTVMTFNLQCSNGNVASILAMVDAYQPEVLALQEVTRIYEQNLLNALNERYAQHTFYQQAGLAIYSQHPILSQEILPAKPWSIQSAVIQVDGTSVQILNGHLANPGMFQVFETRNVSRFKDLADARAYQIEQIDRAISRAGMPAIVACDGNMTDLTSSYAQITNGLQDAFKERGWGLGHTFLIPRGFEIHTPINLPFQRIDYFFHTPEISVTRVQVITQDTGSDHRPLWAQFDLKP